MVTRAGRLLAAHLLILVALAGAVVVRVVAARGYPAPLWSGDSFGYLDAALRFRPHIGRPSGYSVFLAVLRPFQDMGAIVAVQAALGVAAGALVYGVVWRHARAAWPRWILLPGVPATAAAIPVLYDGNLLQSEHMLLADSLFTFLLVAAVAVVLWRPRVSWWTGALAGLLISCAALTRLAGLPLLALVVLAMLLRWSGWKRTLAAVAMAGVVFTLPFLAYMNWFGKHWGEPGITKAGNVWLYGRTADFADCAKIKPPPELAVMCPRPRTDPRVAPAFQMLWSDDNPFQWMPGGIYGEQGNRLAGEFADAAIEAQFGGYVDVVVRDTLRAFKPGREPYPTPWTVQNLSFPEGEEWSDEQELLASPYGGSTARVRVVEPDATTIREYQGRWLVPGPVLAVLLGVGLLGVLARLRPRSRWGGSALLPWSMGAALLVIPAATADFDYRYVTPAVPFACLAAALALIPGMGRRRVVAVGEGAERAETGGEDERGLDSEAEADETREPEAQKAEAQEPEAREPEEAPEPDPDDEPDGPAKEEALVGGDGEEHDTRQQVPGTS
ncbi:hypothetical protein [Actinomadura hibisca]|uniref:hypothetical protein n=1 Tax=Actinomadura hibisca TaxID=68565 RepID=UPI000832DFD7|nr:hypothetical protein [Actinomadura hibisca]